MLRVAQHKILPSTIAWTLTLTTSEEHHSYQEHLGIIFVQELERHPPIYMSVFIIKNVTFKDMPH